MARKRGYGEWGSYPACHVDPGGGFSPEFWRSQPMRTELTDDSRCKYNFSQKIPPPGNGLPHQIPWIVSVLVGGENPRVQCALKVVAEY